MSSGEFSEFLNHICNIRRAFVKDKEGSSFIGLREILREAQRERWDMMMLYQERETRRKFTGEIQMSEDSEEFSEIESSSPRMMGGELGSQSVDGKE